jgi:hypothetical protein
VEEKKNEQHQIIKELEEQAAKIRDKVRFLEEALRALGDIEIPRLKKEVRDRDLDVCFRCGAASILGDVADDTLELMSTIEKLRSK